MKGKNIELKAQRMSVLSTKGAVSNSPGWSEAEPWVQECIAKPPELPVFIRTTTVASGASGNLNQRGYIP